MDLRRYIRIALSTALACGMLSMMACAPAGAHHSFAMFDQTRRS